MKLRCGSWGRGRRERAAHLLADPLPAVLAFDGVFDDGVVGCPAVDERDGIEGDAYADEVEDFVDEGAGLERSLSMRFVCHYLEREKDGFRTYPHDIITAPSSSANFIVL